MHANKLADKKELRELRKKFVISSIIFDRKNFNKKDQSLWDERTNGKIKYYDVKNINIKKYLVSNHNDKKTLNIIKNDKIDLLINLGTPRILNHKIIKAPSIGVLNCHPGILPYYRGCSCVEWALYNNDNVGNTCHLMSKKIDSGPIINIHKLNIKLLKSYVDIRVNLYLNSIKSIISAIKSIKTKKISSFKTKSGGKYYSPIDDDKFNEIKKKFK